jgi:hypothetical protein
MIDLLFYGLIGEQPHYGPSSVERLEAEEASSKQLVNDWDSVALTIVRKSGTRPSLLSHLFQ